MGEVEGFEAVLEEGFEEGFLLGRVDFFKSFLESGDGLIVLEEKLSKVEDEELVDLLEEFLGGVGSEG